MKDDVNFKKFLKEKKYDKCAIIIENKIINYVINLIRLKGVEYEDRGIFDLIEASNKFLDGEEKVIAEKIKFFSIEEEPIEKLERLMELCRTYGIK